MLVSADGAVLIAPKQCVELERAERIVTDRIESDLGFCYKYQVHWLRAYHWDRLANELSGEMFKGYEVFSQSRAAEILKLRSGNTFSQVRIPNRKMPIAESTVRFQKLTLSFLPDGRPCLMERDKKPIYLDEIASEQGLSLVDAARFLIDKISEE